MRNSRLFEEFDFIGHQVHGEEGPPDEIDTWTIGMERRDPDDGSGRPAERSAVDGLWHDPMGI